MAITVTQLNNYIKTLIESDINLNRVMVKGEISNFKLHSSGHCYMTIKDENSAIRAIMFKSYASKLKFTPENGMKIIASGKVSVYERDGQYQLYISSMQSDGTGDLYLAYEQLKEKLSKEGLFDLSHKKTIPPFPKTVGVITSPTGAAVRDIINVVSRRYPLTEILLCPVLVQGDGSASQIANAIDYMNKTKSADVLIVGRGGGSIEDLWSFNEESVAYAIYNSEIPVISAVGHETDFTISDLVADLRAPTPSAAAELAVPSAVEIKSLISNCYGIMLNQISKSIQHKRAVVKGFSVKNPIDYINHNRLRTDNALQKISNFTDSVLRNCRVRLERAHNANIKLSENIFDGKSKEFAVKVAALDAMSPLKVLNRGFSVASNLGGVVKSVDDTKINDILNIKLNDGTVDCTVNNINKEN